VSISKQLKSEVLLTSKQKRSDTEDQKCHRELAAEGSGFFGAELSPFPDNLTRGTYFPNITVLVKCEAAAI
jgi:hypothetical protein